MDPVPMHIDSANDPASLAESQRLASFYEKLLRIQDDVFAGKHPRLKLPHAVLQQFSSRSLPGVAPPTTQTSLAVPVNGTDRAHVNALSQQSATVHTHPSASPFASQQPTAPRPASSKPPSSGIDPVLLQKSDGLIKAELTLKRQRIERVLKDQVDNKVAHIRGNDGGPEASSIFVSHVLARALERVAPVSGLLTSPDGHSASTDVDENSYYSSQAYSWSSEGSEKVREPEPVSPPRDDSHRNEHGRHNWSKTNGVMPSSQHQSAQVGRAARAEPRHPVYPSLSHIPGSKSSRHHATTLDAREIQEDSDEYSPPAADAFPDGSRNDNTAAAQVRSSKTSASVDMVTHQQRIVSPTSPPVRIVQNQIRSPIAPQPSRVSPLAFTKVPRVEQPSRAAQPGSLASGPHPPRVTDSRQQDHRGLSRTDRRSPMQSNRASPAFARGNLNNTRKRRREHDNGDKSRRNSHKRVARSPLPRSPPRSPEPYIKDEPVSPPPFAGFSDPQPGRRRPLRQLADDVEIISPTEAWPRPVYVRDHDQTTYREHYPEPPPPSGLVRVPSRSAHARVERDDHDLRRVASLQYARRPYTPSAPALYTGPAPLLPRAASHTLDRPPAQRVYREESARPAEPRYVRGGLEMSPTLDPYHARARSPAIMRPPPVPRQVVIDSFGNKYYAASEDLQDRPSVAPLSRHVESDPYFERAPTRIRAADPYGETNALQRMPPPSRRYVDPDVEFVDGPSVGTREYSTRPIESYSQRGDYITVREPAERRPLPIYDDAAPREYVARAYSARPDVVRREPPPEYMARHESVQPGREYMRRMEPPPGQLFGEFGAQREYVPLDERGHAYGPPPSASRRYVDDGAAFERPVEVAQDSYGGIGYRRVSYR